MKNQIGKEFKQNSQTTSFWNLGDARARQCLDLLFQQDLAMSVPIFNIGSNTLATNKQQPINLPIGLKQFIRPTNHISNNHSKLPNFVLKKQDEVTRKNVPDY